MDGFGYVCALVLAAVFVRAGVAKLVRPLSTSAAFRALGLPLPSGLARAVPFVELALAVTLVAAPRAGGIASLFVLGLFTRFLSRAVARGAAAPCNCFGTATSEPVSVVDLVRNMMLGALAAAALTATAPVVPDPLRLVAAIASSAVGLLVIRALRRVMAPPAP